MDVPIFSYYGCPYFFPIFYFFIFVRPFSVSGGIREWIQVLPLLVTLL